MARGGGLAEKLKQNRSKTNAPVLYGRANQAFGWVSCWRELNRLWPWAVHML